MHLWPSARPAAISAAETPDRDLPAVRCVRESGLLQVGKKIWSVPAFGRPGPVSSRAALSGWRRSCCPARSTRSGPCGVACADQVDRLTSSPPRCAWPEKYCAGPKHPGLPTSLWLSCRKAAPGGSGRHSPASLEPAVVPLDTADSVRSAPATRLCSRHERYLARAGTALPHKVFGSLRADTDR